MRIFYVIWFVYFVKNFLELLFTIIDDFWVFIFYYLFYCYFLRFLIKITLL